jgi:hypothetical protein
MKILRNVGIIVLVAIVLLLVISLFLPSTMHIEKSRVVKASPAAIFPQINNLKNWTKWAPWIKMDSAIKLTYEGPEAGKGAKYSWQSDNSRVGKGSLWITESVPNQEVSTEMDFADHGTGKSDFKLEPVEGGTKITWSMDGNMGNNPIYKLMEALMKGTMGSQFEKGLTDLNIASSKAQKDMIMQQQTMQASTDTTGVKKDTLVSKM